jgi:hypothetical protein
VDLKGKNIGINAFVNAVQKLNTSGNTPTE